MADAKRDLIALDMDYLFAMIASHRWVSTDTPKTASVDVTKKTNAIAVAYVRRVNGLTTWTAAGFSVRYVETSARNPRATTRHTDH